MVLDVREGPHCKEDPTNKGPKEGPTNILEDGSLKQWCLLGGRSSGCWMEGRGIS